MHDISNDRLHGSSIPTGPQRILLNTCIVQDCSMMQVAVNTSDGHQIAAAGNAVKPLGLSSRCSWDVSIISACKVFLATSTSTGSASDCIFAIMQAHTHDAPCLGLWQFPCLNCIKSLDLELNLDLDLDRSWLGIIDTASASKADMSLVISSFEVTEFRILRGRGRARANPVEAITCESMLRAAGAGLALPSEAAFLCCSSRPLVARARCILWMSSASVLLACIAISKLQDKSQEALNSLHLTQTNDPLEVIGSLSHYA